MKNPYEILGVKGDASEDQIKRAYRKLAKELHPDVNPGDKIVEQRFKEVTAANEVLSDKEKRGKFDRGEIDADGAPRYENAFHRAHTQAGDFGFNFGGAGGPNVEDLFSGLFGRGRQRGGTRTTRIKGQDVRYTVRVDFISAAKGVKRRIQLYDGKTLDVTIPPGTTDGQALRLKGQGMSGMGGGAAGDAIVEVMVDTHP
ncbi:MAG: DnaJ domain-containing protein, partial [Alphaproteobacteria bacterium]|nr:DnaJ domain-containing protein [Alphaproteobacteria bacterium]